MPLPLVWSDWSDRRFPFRSGYFHRIPAASLKNFSIRTGVCSLWHGCMFLCVDNLYSLHIRRPLLLIHNRSYFSAFLGKAALTSFQHGMYRYLLFHHTPCSPVCWYPAWNCVFSISHRSVDLCMASASALAGRCNHLRFQTSNPPSHSDNGIPASSPLFSERESASRHHFGPGVSKTSINIFYHSLSRW